MNIMSFGELTLDQLGAHADAHYKAGEKANQRAMDQGKSAGLYLAEAKRRIDEATPYGQRTQAFEVFLKERCPSVNAKGPRRAYQLIEVATGKKTIEEVREKDRNSKREARAKVKAASFEGRPAKVQEPAPAPTLRFQAPPEPDERDAIMSTITAKLAKLSIDQLHAIERLIPHVS